MHSKHTISWSKVGRLGIILLLVVLSFGCGSSGGGSDQPGAVRERKSPLVIGERSVDQIRGGMRLAEIRYNTDFYTLASRHYKASMLARGTGKIYATAWDPDAEDPCSVSTTTGGTGLLSSDTRMVTALHVVSGVDPDSFDQPIEVSFDGSSSKDNRCHKYYSHGDWDLKGSFLKDYVDEDDDKYTSGYEWDETPGGERFGIVDGDDGTKSNIVEENPLLANRLYQLGLHVWAEDTYWKDQNGDRSSYATRGREKRNKLRHDWPFALDELSEQDDALKDPDNNDLRLDVQILPPQLLPPGREGDISREDGRAASVGRNHGTPLCRHETGGRSDGEASRSRALKSRSVRRLLDVWRAFFNRSASGQTPQYECRS